MAQEGSTAPGTTVNFNLFKGLALGAGAGGTPVFTATLIGAGVSGANDVGLWGINSTGTLTKLLREGDQLDIGGGTMRTVQTMTVLSLVTKSQTQTRSLAANRVVVRVFFTGTGGQALYKITMD